MPRSPTDATRFTSTGPYVSTKPSSTGFPFNSGAAPAISGTQIDFGAAPPNESPQQKIARLRAAAAAAKRGRESGFDKTVRIGRVWADRAHRVTAIGLIGLTVVSGAVATAGITDMLLHNRKRRKEWLAEKQAESARELVIARRAEVEGRATEDQMLLINRERAAAEAEETKKNRPGMFSRASNYLFSGLSEEEQKGGRLGAAAVEARATASELKSDAEAAFEEGKSTLQTIGDKIDGRQRQSESALVAINPSGGPLDRQADQAINAATKAARSWTSWITGR